MLHATNLLSLAIILAGRQFAQLKRISSAKKVRPKVYRDDGIIREARDPASSSERQFTFLAFSHSYFYYISHFCHIFPVDECGEHLSNQFLLSSPGFLISNLSEHLLSDSILIRASYSPL